MDVVLPRNFATGKCAAQMASLTVAQAAFAGGT